jgi:hypothetical protein
MRRQLKQLKNVGEKVSLVVDEPTAEEPIANREEPRSVQEEMEQEVATFSGERIDTSRIFLCVV